MYGDGGQGNHIFAEFQAKLLGQGKPPDEDPVEEHMQRVKKLVFRWTSALVVIAGASLWIGGVGPALALAAGATLLVLGAMALRRRRLAASVEIPRVVL
jgi:hypothetical protein